MTYPPDSPPPRLQPRRLHPAPARLPGPALHRGGFEPDAIAAYLAGLAAQYESIARIFPSPPAAPRAGSRPPRLTP